MSKTKRVLVCCAAGILSISAMGADWTQYRGPNGDGKSNEKVLAAWPAAGPKVLWKTKVGGGVGSMAIVGGKVFVGVQSGNAEHCVALDLKTGNQLWTSEVDPQSMARRGMGNGGPGPFTTPAVSDGKVYATSTFLKIACLNAADGKLIWKHDLGKEYAGQLNEMPIKNWGSATSPVVEGDLVIMMGGGPNQMFIAFNKNTGEVVWKKHTDSLTQSTPVPAVIDGVRQLLFFAKGGLWSLEPKTGEVLWKFPARSAMATGASPVVEGNVVFYSAGYGTGGGACEVKKAGDAFEAKPMWTTPGKNATQWSTSVIKDGYVYLINDGGGTDGAKLQCTDLKTGAAKWTGPAVGQGELMLIDGKLLIQGSKGALILAEPSPDAYKELSRAQPLTGQAWGLPAFSDGILVYRTTAEMAAVELKP